MESRRKKILTNIVKYLLFLALTAVCLYFAFKDYLTAEAGQPSLWDELHAGLQSANGWWIIVSMVAGYAAFLVRARRWQFIIEPLGHRPSFKNTYDAVMLTYLSNFALPRMGEVVRCGTLHKTEKFSFESLLGTVVLERVFDLVCLVVICVMVVLLNLQLFGNFVYHHIWQPVVQRLVGQSYVLPIVIAVGVALLFLGLYLFRRKIRTLPMAAKLQKVWKGLIDGLKAGFKLQYRGKFFAYTVLLWVLYWLQAFAVIMALPDTIHLSAIDALFLMVIGGLGWVVPVQGGMGAYHLLISLTLATIYHIDNGIVFATISHETQAVVMIVFGLISWASFMLTKPRRTANG